MKNTMNFFNYINGNWVESDSGEIANSKNPAQRSEVVGTYQLSTALDFDKAANSAKNATKEWRRLSGDNRGDYLIKIASILEERMNDIALTMTKEMGKTLTEAKGETARGVAILRYYAGEGLR